MHRWGRFLGASVAVWLVAAAPAHARVASPWAQAVVTSCSRATHEAVFEGRVSPYHRSARMQMRFTLQARTPDEPQWRKIRVQGWGLWVTAPAGLERYIYDKTVEELLAPASYRAAVEFRWRATSGRVTRTQRVLSPACRMPDPRPDLRVRSLSVDRPLPDGRRRYVALVTNRGRDAAGAFAVDFYAAGEGLGTVDLDGVAAGESATAVLSAPACTPGQQIRAVVDAGAAVDEADEDDNTATVVC